MDGDPRDCRKFVFGMGSCMLCGWLSALFRSGMVPAEAENPKKLRNAIDKTAEWCYNQNNHIGNLIGRRRVMNASAVMMMTGMRMCAMCTCVMQFFVTSTPEKNTAA